MPASPDGSPGECYNLSLAGDDAAPPALPQPLGRRDPRPSRRFATLSTD